MGPSRNRGLLVLAYVRSLDDAAGRRAGWSTAVMLSCHVQGLQLCSCPDTVQAGSLGSRQLGDQSAALSKLSATSAGSRMAVTRGCAAAGTRCASSCAAVSKSPLPAAAAAAATAAAAARGLPGKCKAWQGSSTLHGVRERWGVQYKHEEGNTCKGA